MFEKTMILMGIALIIIVSAIIKVMSNFSKKRSTIYDDRLSKTDHVEN